MAILKPRGATAMLPLLVLAVCATTALAQARDIRITVATYNVRSFLDDLDDPFTFDEERPPKAREELEQIAAAIRKMNADVIAFQEVENEQTLRAFVHELLGGMKYRHVVVSPTNSMHGLNLGVISRLPIDSFTSHRHRTLNMPDPTQRRRFARDVLRVRIDTPAQRHLDLYVVHFKSKYDSEEDPESKQWRLAEARATRRIVDEALAADPSAWVLLLGDLNDAPDSGTLRSLLKRGGPEAPKPLLDLHEKLPARRRVTYLRGRHRGTVDYMLASPALAERLVRGSARVLDDPSVLDGSDHAPLFASFNSGLSVSDSD